MSMVNYPPEMWSCPTNQRNSPTGSSNCLADLQNSMINFIKLNKQMEQKTAFPLLGKLLSIN